MIKSSCSTFALVTEVTINISFEYHINISSITPKISIVPVCMTEVLAVFACYECEFMCAFLIDFRFLKASPARQGKVLKVKQNSEFK